MLLLLAACNVQPHAWAGRVEDRSQLIGGPRAIGDLGDYRISNDRVRFIVQGIDHPSRAFGAFGGSLIDADLVRGEELRDPRTQLDGRDGLGEIFPAFFLQGIEPDKLEVLADGADGLAAHLRVSGKPGEFYTATAFADDVLLGKDLAYSIDYALGPLDDALTMTLTMTNVGTADHFFPVNVAPLPIGLIALFGEGQPVFLMGEAGYDARFTLQDAYARPFVLPAMPGLATDAVAIDGKDVSYGLTADTGDYVWNHRDQYGNYGPVTPQSMLVPMVSSTLFAVYAGEPPLHLAPGDSYTTTMRLRVAPGGVSKQIDYALSLSGDDGQHVEGVVREDVTEEPLAGATVVFIDADGRYVSSARSDSGGRFSALLPAGSYRAVARKEGRWIPPPMRFDLKPRATVHLEPHLPRPAYLAVQVTDGAHWLPAKITVEGTYDSTQQPRGFLYDLKIGDRYRPTNLGGGRFIENVLRAPLGEVTAELRPGRYHLTVSRGPEYSVQNFDLNLVEGEATKIAAVLERLVPAGNTIAADLHVHAIGSVDADLPLDERVASYAIEGVDFLALTEHNFISDARPAIERTGLTDFVQSTSGIEVSSLEAGHWNAYPLTMQPGPAAHGAPEWFRHDPAQLFRAMRALGSDDTVVQVNHPRDPAQGYFTAFGMTGDTLTGDPLHDWPGKTGLLAPSGLGDFSLQFDAVELLTGKRMDLLRTYRVPDPPPPPPHPPLGPPGSIVRDSAGLVAFPGSIEDYEHLLDAGKRFTAVANSDSHVVWDDAGYPRNVIDLGHPVASAREIDEREVARAVKAGRVLLTTGPRITLDVPTGALVKPDANGYVTLHVQVDAPPWMDVQRGRLLVSQGPCDESEGDCHAIDLGLDPERPVSAVRRFDGKVSASFARDGWMAVEVEGDASLWPVVTPMEVPPLLIGDALDRVVASFGIADPFGNLKPSLVQTVRPWAMTNPIYVDGNRDGLFGRSREPPGFTPGAGDSALLRDLRVEVRR